MKKRLIWTLCVAFLFAAICGAATAGALPTAEESEGTKADILDRLSEDAAPGEAPQGMLINCAYIFGYGYGDIIPDDYIERWNENTYRIAEMTAQYYATGDDGRPALSRDARNAILAELIALADVVETMPVTMGGDSAALNAAIESFKSTAAGHPNFLSTFSAIVSM